MFLYSIHNAVISVFQRKDLGENELYTLNEGVRSAISLFVFCCLPDSLADFHIFANVTLELVCILGKD